MRIVKNHVLYFLVFKNNYFQDNGNYFIIAIIVFGY